MNPLARMDRYCAAIAAFTEAANHLADHRAAGTTPTATETNAEADARAIMAGAQRAFVEGAPALKYVL